MPQGKTFARIIKVPDRGKGNHLRVFFLSRSIVNAASFASVPPEVVRCVVSSEVLALANLLDSIQASLRDRIGGGIGRLPGRPESWGFAGTPTLDAVKMLTEARKACQGNWPKLLECGAGFGFTAALAKELGFDVTGIEIMPAYVEVSRQFFPSVRMFLEDLLTFDRFGEFDAIYYNGPFADERTQIEFENKVERCLRPGGVIVAIRKASEDWKSNGLFEVIWTNNTHQWVLKKRRR